MVGLLIRHGHAEEAERLRQALHWLPLSAVYCSPLEHAIETAQPLARDRGLDVHLRAALTDVDLDDSTVRSREEVSAARVSVQERIVDELMKLARSHAGETIAIVTHAEPIRCALAAFAGSSLDDIMAIDISPGHVSSVGIAAPHVRRVLGVNLPADQVAV